MILHLGGFAQLLSTEGKEFWFGFMENHEVNPVSLEVFISAQDSTSGLIEIPGFNWSREFNVARDSTTRIIVPTNLAMANGSGIIQSSGIHIQTENIVSVYALNSRTRSADVAVILPITALGKEYFVMAHREADGGGPSLFSEFLVVAAEDNTTIEIVPSANTTDGKPAGLAYTIILNAGQVYQIQSGSGDLTGSQVSTSSLEDCTNFAVFGGNEWTRVGLCGGLQDHLYEQMYPVSTWGMNYSLIPFLTRLGGDVYKFIASEDSTEIYMDDNFFRLLNAGEFFQSTIIGARSISANKPISVAQFSRSTQCDNQLGDPFMIMISPDEQMLDKITFNALQVTVIENYYLNVLTQTVDIDKFFIDGGTQENMFSELPGNPDLSYARLQIQSGNHTLESIGGFIAYVYGYGDIESFGYATGVSLQNLNLQVTPVDAMTGLPITIEGVCVGNEVIFTASSDVDLEFFEWDFGDGTGAIGDTVLHAYNTADNFFVSVEGFTVEGSCTSQEKATIQVPVVRPIVEILGPFSVCPNVEAIDYTVMGESGNSYSWFIDGGSFQSGTIGDSVKVDWGSTNGQASISLVPVDNRGCVGDTTLAPVRINVQLEPAPPIGLDSLCSSDIIEVSYFTFFSNGSSYDWRISGGVISSGNGSNEVLMNWDGPGISQLWYEESSTLDDLCSGISDTLSVFIEREPYPNMILTASQTTAGIGEEISFEVEADPQFNFFSWDFADGLIMDSLESVITMNHSYNCAGVYDLKLNAHTGKVCQETGQGNVLITVVNPEIELVSVSHSLEKENQLEINWKLNNIDFYEKEIQLSKRKVSPDTLDWQLIANIDKESGGVIDGISDTSVYQYQIKTNFDCSPIETLIHNNIRLRITVDDENQIQLFWNTYENWENGVQNYEIWLQIDDNEMELLASTSSTSFSSFYNEDGFVYQYRIRAIESGGNERFSWSNSRFTEFVPEIKTYNVFTPNGDQKNQTFMIEGVELYTRSTLAIFDRDGKEVFSATGYQNNWSGKINGRDAAAGVYYFVLELNEPRAEVQTINGVVSILR
ncbi:MAG: gliding motility-associated C-terminal domain-containing protein [Bacteroidetes bacterium]|nr:gliding motility-associated C-terminal domain-containing protein [Bacteroidota bacterium]